LEAWDRPASGCPVEGGNRLKLEGNVKDRARILWFFWPTAIFTVSVAVYLFPELAFQQLASDPDPNAMQRLSAAVAFYSCAWLLARIFGAALKKTGRRKVPRLLREL